MCYRFELALQQNEIMDVFYDDWLALADEDSTFGSKADNHLKVSNTALTIVHAQSNSDIPLYCTVFQVIVMP